ncbi:MAG: lipopolysaccharide heptosyltransferase II [Candidatus Omnitrophica bacterium]|nr:lipopolysaccharide heptosyltransferase II [Candidatus Omnitrophota bacterium]
MNKKEYRRILIIEVNWLGDVLFSTPFIRSVRGKFKDAHIACLTVPRTVEILEGNPNINEIIIYDENSKHKSFLGKARLIRSLRRKRFDLVIILHRSFTRAIIAFLSGIRERIGYATKKRRFLLTRPVEIPDKVLHKVDYFLGIAGFLGCDTSNRRYEFFVTENDRVNAKRKLEENGVKNGDFLVILNPGGNWMPKRWNAKNFAGLADILIDKYKAKIIITGAEKDITLAREIKGMMKNDAAILAGRTNLKELGATAEMADFFISGDTGPSHIAVAMGCNAILLYGPTSPLLTGPYGNGNYTVVQKNTSCEVPCYDLQCDDYRCMDEISVNDVLSAFEDMYKNAQNRKV